MTEDFVRTAIDLAQPRLGSRVVFATDDFFADKSRLIAPEEPVFLPGKYDENGKWMDGWESRRRRDPGHDTCIIRLGRPGRIRGFEIDTRHFTGNYPPATSIDACRCATEQPPAETTWTPLLPVTAIEGDSRKYAAALPSDEIFSHVRLNIYPDGGVARLRIYGEIHRDWTNTDGSSPVDLAAMENGGRALICNNEHFGRLQNLIAPGRAASMADGWETRRRREPGADWGIIALACTGVIERITVDTLHFKGNFPDRCSLQGSGGGELPPEALAAQSLYWPVLLPEQKLTMHAEHQFEAEIVPHEPVRFVRFNIIPDGGVSRLRLRGRPAI